MAVIPKEIFTNPQALNAFFDPDELDAPVLGVAARYDSPDLHTPRSGHHSHSKGQLVFTRQGSTTVEFRSQLYIVPPYRAVWIPPHTPHKTTQRQIVEFRSIYFDMTRFSQLPPRVAVLSLSPLLMELVERVALSDFGTNWFKGRELNLLKVLIDEISEARRTTCLLPRPRDFRMKPLLDLLTRGTLPPSLKELAALIGASDRTICRIFCRETGMNYRTWRQQWRLMRAIELISTRTSVSNAAEILGFTSESAFIAFFKQHTGSTPGGYLHRR